MTENEIIKVLDDIWTFGHEPTDEERFAANKAISLIQELEQYRAIGTVEECWEARERQRGKKPVIGNDNGRPRKCCSVCGCFYSPTSKYCPKCGQGISQDGE